MKYKLLFFDEEEQEFEMKNQIFNEISFETRQAVEFVIHAIKNELPFGFQYKIVPYE